VRSELSDAGLLESMMPLPGCPIHPENPVCVCVRFDKLEVVPERKYLDGKLPPSPDEYETGQQRGAQEVQHGCAAVVWWRPDLNDLAACDVFPRHRTT